MYDFQQTLCNNLTGSPVRLGESTAKGDCCQIWLPNRHFTDLLDVLEESSFSFTSQISLCVTVTAFFDWWGNYSYLKLLFWCIIYMYLYYFVICQLLFNMYYLLFIEVFYGKYYYYFIIINIIGIWPYDATETEWFYDLHSATMQERNHHSTSFGIGAVNLMNALSIPVFSNKLNANLLFY